MNFGQTQCYSGNTFGLEDTPNLRIPLSVVCNSDYCNYVTLNGRQRVHPIDPHLAELLWTKCQVHTSKWNESMTCCTHAWLYLNIFKYIDILALTPYGYKWPCNIITLHVLAASPKCRFKTFLLLLSTSVVIFHTSIILQSGLPHPFRHLDSLQYP